MLKHDKIKLEGEKNDYYQDLLALKAKFAKMEEEYKKNEQNLKE